MHLRAGNRWIACVCLFGINIGLLAQSAGADPGVYEPNADPGVGFNLISWWNYGAAGASIWGECSPVDSRRGV